MPIGHAHIHDVSSEAPALSGGALEEDYASNVSGESGRPFRMMKCVRRLSAFRAGTKSIVVPGALQHGALRAVLLRRPGT
jgi:hypothetical protein